MKIPLPIRITTSHLIAESSNPHSEFVHFRYAIVTKLIPTKNVLILFEFHHLSLFEYSVHPKLCRL